MQLESIGVQQATNKRMQWKSKPTREESLKAYPLIRRRSRNRLVSWDTHIASHHHAISNQRTQICSPEGGSLPLSGHPGRFNSRTGVSGHRSHSEPRKGKDEGSRAG